MGAEKQTALPSAMNYNITIMDNTVARRGAAWRGVDGASSVADDEDDDDGGSDGEQGAAM